MIRMRLPFHPTARMLHRYAEGTLSDTSSLWLKRHLASCYECRASVSFTRSLRDALATLPATIPLDPALIDRVMADRAAGERAVLPTAEPEAARPVRRRRFIPVLAAAAAVLFMVGVSRVKLFSSREESARVRPDLTRRASAPPIEEFAVSEFFLPRSAFASELTAGDSSVPPLTSDGGRLRAATLHYTEFVRVAGEARRRVGTESVELSEARVEGRDAWRVIQRRQVGDTEHVETLYADRATLRILGRTVRVKPYLHYLGITVRQRLVGDSLTGWMQTDSGLGRPIARQLSPRSAPYLSDALAPVLLGATTLGPEWRGRFSILGWAVRNGDVSFPVRLRVIGDERITVAAGTFDCWKVDVQASVGMQTYWVRKSDGVGVRALFQRDAMARELVLTR